MEDASVFDRSSDSLAASAGAGKQNTNFHFQFHFRFSHCEKPASYLPHQSTTTAAWNNCANFRQLA